MEILLQSLDSRWFTGKVFFLKELGPAFPLGLWFISELVYELV